MNIIRSHGTINKVTLVDGTEIYNDKRNKIWIPEYGTFIPCAPYLNHFLFEVPARILGPAWLCSCGSIAVNVGMKAYAHLSSDKEAMLVCLQHTSSNKHSDGAS